MSLFNEQEALVAATIYGEIGGDPSKIARTANFKTDLGCDSLDVVQIVMAAEDRFDIEITDNVAEKIETVADLFAAVAAAKS